MHTAVRRGGLIAAAVLVALLGAACTPDPAPQPTPTPTASSTPPETAQEREQRIAYAAAETSYRAYRTEFSRVLRAGGSAQPTTLMKANAGGPYLTSTQEVAAAFRGLQHHDVGVEKIAYVRFDGFSQNELVLTTCEDSADVKTVDKGGRVLYNGDIRKLTLTVRLSSGRWKVWDGTGAKATSCE